MNEKLDLYVVYHILKRLSTPFEKWDAFKKGIIDNKGNILKNRSDLTDEERENWTHIDILTTNLKRALMKVPDARQKMASIVLALYFMKEVQGKKAVTSEPALKRTQGQIPGWSKINTQVKEDAIPANAVGGGNIAALGVGAAGEPPVRKRKKILKRIMLTYGNDKQRREAER